MKAIFCSEPFAPNKPDFVYEKEVDAARAAGFEIDLIDFEVLTREENTSKAVRRIWAAETAESAVYRGWMLNPEIYAGLFRALSEKNINLINSPEEYRHCHYLPESYKEIEAHTPLTISLPYDENFSFHALHEKLKAFGEKPIILKDYVKSRKHEWNEACFIHSAADKNEVERVVRRFLELQDEDLNAGLVFREFVDFEPLATHSKSGMPLTLEYRFFFLDGNRIFSTEYWEEGDYQTKPPENLFSDVALRINSRFFTMDVALQKIGEWMIVELGDAQVSGLPETADVSVFYQNLNAALLQN